MKHPIMGLAPRIFLLSFVPVSLAALAALFTLRGELEESIRAHLRRTLLSSEQTIEKIRDQAEMRHQHLIADLAENASLKAGLALWRDVGQEEARKTVEDQLLDFAPRLGYDLLAVFDANYTPLGAVAMRDGRPALLGIDRVPLLTGRLEEFDGNLFQVTSVPINLDNEFLGRLSVGQLFDLSLLQSEAALVKNGKVIRSNVSGAAPSEVERALASCRSTPDDCQLRLRGENYLATSVNAARVGSGYALWAFQSIDKASAGLLQVQNKLLSMMAFTVLLAALLVSAFASRPVVRPLSELIAGLKESERTGVLRGDFKEDGSVAEVNELAGAFNSAARSIAAAQRQLDEAYLAFTKTMAQALDARDHYTAGHSTRVSEYAGALAEALNLSAKETEDLRMAAALHDIGKIGVPDAVLQKAGALTAEEFKIIQQHPVIGKRILESVARFRDYLDVVELHHENHDGSGYPWGLRGEQVPLAARIVHVVDSYDAMTTHRPYRQAKPKAEALQILRMCSGTQFDPAVVEVFLKLLDHRNIDLAEASTQDLSALREALSAEHAVPIQGKIGGRT